jgi:hypothetical protein
VIWVLAYAIQTEANTHDRQCTYNITMMRVRATIVEMERQYLLDILCVCILALVVRHARRRLRIILSSAACLSLPYFSTLSFERHAR